MEENKNLLLKGAMTYGLAMGIYWVVKYIFFIFSVSVPSLSLVYWLLTLAVPFIAYYMTKRYRQRHRWKDQFLSCMEIRHDVVFFRRIDRLA